MRDSVMTSFFFFFFLVYMLWDIYIDRGKIRRIQLMEIVNRSWSRVYDLFLLGTLLSTDG